MDKHSTPFDVQRFLIPKTGSSPEECEDAFDVSWLPDAGSLVVAVSDGASESLLAGAWARTLSNGAVESMAAAGPPDVPCGYFVEDLLSRTVDRWDGYVVQYQADRAARGRPIAWYEQPGLAKGAFATLTAVRVQPRSVDHGAPGAAREWTWNAFALGDSCLFHLRESRLITAFPIADEQGFGITPPLLGSRNRDAALIAARASTVTGELHEGDELLVTTDALAAWFLGHPEIDSGGAGKQLGRIADLERETFADWVQNERDKARMRNDDVALVRIRVRTEG